jgi:signal transduction histidine kinase
LADAKPAAAAAHLQLGIEQEPRRLARELHDETLQNLAALGWTLGAAQRAKDTETARAAVNEAILQVRQEIANLRRLIADLRPVALAGAGLEAAIHELAGRVQRFGLEVFVRVDVDARRSDTCVSRLELETATYRIVQEVLTNARKHGRASRALVDVRQRGSSIQITVRDDGDGFEPGAMQAGMGLLGMRERVELFDGMLRLESAPEHGTTVRAVLFEGGGNEVEQSFRELDGGLQSSLQPDIHAYKLDLSSGSTCR